MLTSANGNLSNNIAMKLAVCTGEGPGRRDLVTTLTLALTRTLIRCPPARVLAAATS